MVQIANRRQIPVARPLLPKHEAIVPYLKEIDENRWYSNFGPLVREFERRLEHFFKVDKGCVVSSANGTIAITDALRAFDLPYSSYCILPSWTFVATPAAAVAAGLTPYFVDVDEETWALDPDAVKNRISRMNGNIGCVIAVAPYGMPISVRKWEKFHDDTGIPVLIDAAAGFDSVSSAPENSPGKIPMMVSFHATKPFGMGEGAMIICRNPEFIEQVRQMSNFGFNPTRIIHLPGTNGKMSEYNAAVGLAALDKWQETKASWHNVTNMYIDEFEKYKLPHFMSREWITSTCNVPLPWGSSDAVMNTLGTRGIDTRKWWLNGCHRHPAYTGYPHDPLPVTEKLAYSVVGLPYFRDMDRDDISYIVSELNDIIFTVRSIISSMQESKRASL